MNHIPILEKASALWNKDQIRVLVMTSLTMQILLILFAPLRKRHGGNKLLLFLLWLVYLGADYVATLALGIILTHTKHNTLGGHSGVDLVALWAPFLLLHLGGPDNITSYSLEDNELWLRHFLGFAVQVSMALMVLVLSNMQSTKLLVPSVLVFLIGVTKFGERTLALRSATIERLRDSIKKDFEDRRRSLERRIFERLRILPTSDEIQTDAEGTQEDLRFAVPTAMIDSPINPANALAYRALTDEEVTDLSDVDFICRGKISFFMHGYYTVSTSHPLRIEDIMHWNWNARAFETIAIELSFFYDVFHTKATLIHCRIGRMLRLVSLVSISIALIFFHISEKWGHDSSDVIITYILLSMALFLDIYSLLLLVISKWTIVTLVLLNKNWSRILAEFICIAKKHGNKRGLPRHMGQYSLIQTCVRSIRDKHLTRRRHSRSILTSVTNMWGSGITLYSLKSAWQFLFGEEQSLEEQGILEKLMIEHVRNLIETIPTAFFWQGYRDLARKLRSFWLDCTLDRDGSYLSESKDVIRGGSFDQCVIAWHMATEICYLASNDTSEGRKTEQCRKSEAIYRVSKYMMHLLLKRSSMMPQGIAKERMEGTLDDFCQMSFDDVATIDAQRTTKLLWEEPSKLPIRLGGISVINFTRVLLKDLTKISETSLSDNRGRGRWEVIGHAWMEMLTYAALHCSPTEHVKTLSRGGELLTYHWLLLAHNGILEEFNYYFTRT